MEAEATKFEYEDEPAHEPVEHFNRDMTLLLVLVLIEIAQSKRDNFYLKELLKGDYWKIDDVWDEVQDTNDYESMPQMVLAQISFILEDLRLGKMRTVNIDGIGLAFESLAKIIRVSQKSNEYDIDEVNGLIIKDYAGLYCDLIEKRLQPEKDNKPNSLAEKLLDDSISYSANRYYQKLQPVIATTPDRIVIEADFDISHIKIIEASISDFLNKFVQDGLLADPPPYTDKRICFSKQIENFIEYVARLKPIGNTIHFPFDILSGKYPIL